MATNSERSWNSGPRSRKAAATSATARLIATDEATALLGLHPNTLWAEAREGRIPSILAADSTGARLFDRAVIEALAVDREASR
jgi:hypothetical protein